MLADPPFCEENQFLKFIFSIIFYHLMPSIKETAINLGICYILRFLLRTRQYLTAKNAKKYAIRFTAGKNGQSNYKILNAKTQYSLILHTFIKLFCP